jgi:hypothetical protein
LCAPHDQSEFGPANVWPAGHAWLIYSDEDLWATRVDGPHALIEALRDDPDVDTVALSFIGYL